MNFFVPLRQNMNIKAENRAKKWRLPAEWEPQMGVQLTWPHADTDWAPILNDITETYHEMAREIAKRERLIIVASEGAARDMLRFVCPYRRYLGTRSRLHHPDRR